MKDDITPINGIILDGKFYEMIEGKCRDCVFNLPPPNLCKLGVGACGAFDLDGIFRFSQSITDKLNKK